jgi:hypothetical protein
VIGCDVAGPHPLRGAKQNKDAVHITFEALFIYHQYERV